MAIKEFADGSSVSIAYTRSDAASSAEFEKQPELSRDMTYVPYTEDAHSAGLESVTSNAITDSRRVTNSKNTRGTANAGWTAEMGFAGFIKDMLEMSFMSSFQQVKAGNNATGVELLVDGKKSQFFISEKRIANGNTRNFRRTYGNLVNELTITFGDNNVGTIQIATNAANFEHYQNSGTSGSPEEGGMGAMYIKPEPYEMADAANNVRNMFVLNQAGKLVELSFSQATLTLSNNVRAQNAMGHVFAKGMSKGRAEFKVTGTAFYEDDQLLSAHFANQKLQLVLPITTEEGTVVFISPRLSLASPTNSGGQNQDFTMSISLTAEEGVVTIGGEQHQCLAAVLWAPAGVNWQSVLEQKYASALGGDTAPAPDKNQFSMSERTKTVKVGDEFTLTLNNKPAGDVMWGSTVQSIVQSLGGGKYKALAEGSAEAEAIVGSSAVRCAVTVTK